MTGPIVIAMKSTVPVGTTEKIKEIISANTEFPVEIVSNPEFLREGSGVYDAFHGDRIVIGASNEKAATLIERKLISLLVFRYLRLICVVLK